MTNHFWTSHNYDSHYATFLFSRVVVVIQKDVKNGSGRCLHVSNDAVGTTKHITGRPGVSIM